VAGRAVEGSPTRGEVVYSVRVVRKEFVHAALSDSPAGEVPDVAPVTRQSAAANIQQGSGFAGKVYA
jgi:hypothetical protein